MSHVELGFLENCEPWQVESRLFPSKAGGKPAWLDLHHLPSSQNLLCKTCDKPMIFLLQIYAPYEEDPHLSPEDCENNFHRTLFVFVCRNSKCCLRNTSNNIKVFRSSLQKTNKFYSQTPPEDRPDYEFSLNKWAKLCNLCGCSSEKQCAKCKKVNYCSREHQVLDWKNGHKKECGTDTVVEKKHNALFPEWEIVTEPEEIEKISINEEEELEKFNKLHKEGKTGTMKDVSESDLDVHASAETDKVFAKFQKQIKSNPDQVIRYQRDGDPLWIAEEPKPDTIPDCEYCGSKRRFEFQIMPQLLSMLKENDLDWGVIMIYTCAKSCAGDSRYKEEFVFKQDIDLKSL